MSMLENSEMGLQDYSLELSFSQFSRNCMKGFVIIYETKVLLSPDLLQECE